MKISDQIGKFFEFGYWMLGGIPNLEVMLSAKSPKRVGCLSTAMLAVTSCSCYTSVVIHTKEVMTTRVLTVTTPEP